MSGAISGSLVTYVPKKHLVFLVLINNTQSETEKNSTTVINR